MERAKAALEEQKQQAKAASEAPGPGARGHSGPDGDQASLTEPGRPQDAADPRAKNAGKGKKTADKWNQ